MKENITERSMEEPVPMEESNSSTQKKAIRLPQRYLQNLAW